MVTKVCQHCNATFEAMGKGSINMKYCPTCRPLAHKLKEKRRRPRQRIPCPKCGQPMCPNNKHGLCRSCLFKEASKLGIWPSGSRHHWYKNGKPKTSEGYIRIKRPNHPFADHNGYVLEHRWVIEQHLGRILGRKEFVHHLNGIRNDNRLKNLAVVSSSNHSSNTLKKLFQKRIRDLEAELAQQKF